MTNKGKKKKVLLAALAIMAVFLVSVSFVTSTTYTQLAISSLLYPPVIYLVFRYFPNSSNKTNKDRVIVQVKANTKRKREAVEIIDFDKRAFLKMILSAGFSFFVFSLFTRRVEDLIVSRNGGQRAPILDRDSSSANPTEGYKVSEIATEDYNYYGFVNKDGGWYIMKEDPTVGSFRYVKGNSSFSSDWERRARLKYNYYHMVFN